MFCFTATRRKVSNRSLLNGQRSKAAQLSSSRARPQPAKAAPFKRNDVIPAVMCDEGVHFPGTRIQEDLACTAEKLGTSIWMLWRASYVNGRLGHHLPAGVALAGGMPTVLMSNSHSSSL